MFSPDIENLLVKKIHKLDLVDLSRLLLIQTVCVLTSSIQIQNYQPAGLTLFVIVFKRLAGIVPT